MTDMPILAVNSNDLVILAGMLLAIIGGIAGAWWARLTFVRLGLILSALAVCLGLAHFGLNALVGGARGPESFFGSTVLVVGVLSAFILCAVDEAYRRLAAAPEGPRGFPVLPRRVDPPA